MIRIIEAGYVNGTVRTPENELTRETIGTGIGLALVHHLAQAMNGKVDVVNQNPGPSFGWRFR